MKALICIALAGAGRLPSRPAFGHTVYLVDEVCHVAYVDDRDPGDEDRRPVGHTGFRGAQFADELDALAEDETTPTIQAFITKLAEGKLK